MNETSKCKQLNCCLISKALVENTAKQNKKKTKQQKKTLDFLLSKQFRQ